MLLRLAWLVILPLLVVGCGDGERVGVPAAPGPDPHSFARFDQAVVSHLELDLQVDFERQILAGRATLTIENPAGGDELWLDSNGLDVSAVSTGPAGSETPTDFHFGEADEILGRPLVVRIGPGVERVHIDYATRPGASALQWLDAAQTTSGRRPFLLSQSQSIHARSWIPCQDSPAVRMTYEATIRVPPGLLALMSAENPQAPAPDGVHHFRMPQPVPSYLLALAVGELEFRALGPRSGVYAEPAVIDAASYEFAETEAMMQAAEQLYGSYRWGRFDVLVLPASFPYGGMENPRLTFVTPTLIAGDRSLVTTIAHELAHSWSGNLVTNATWNDFWLNEGFTVYLENRIMEVVYGDEFARMNVLLGREALEEDLRHLDPTLTHLYVDLAGRDPDDGFSTVPYEKGNLYLTLLERHFGRERWDEYLRGYFERFAFESLTTERFLEDLRERLVVPAGAATGSNDPDVLEVADWIYGPGLPASVPAIRSRAFDIVDAQIDLWLEGAPARDLVTERWNTQQWLHFVGKIPESTSPEQFAELDAAFGLTASGNAEIRCAWLIKALAGGYGPALPAVREFLTSVGRLKFLEPLYGELVRTASGRETAASIFAEARPFYHPLAVRAVEGILDGAGVES